MSDAVETIVDDRNPAIQYSGAWILATGSEFEHLNTSTITGSIGDSASLNFNGTSISVYGTITPTGAQPISNYTIDSGVPYQFAAQQLTKIQYQQLFFYATGLASGLLHTLVITNVANNGYLSLDYFQIESPDPGSSTSSSLNMPISSSSTRPSTTLTPSQTSSEPESTTTRPSTTSTTSLTPQISLIGAAIGGSVAASMIISLILFACFFARRRRRRKKNLPLPDSLSPPQLDMSHALAGRSSDITPFVIGDHLGLARSASASEGVVTAGRKENGRDGDQDLPPEYSVSPDNVR